jgi:hypothetical protein
MPAEESGAAPLSLGKSARPSAWDGSAGNFSCGPAVAPGTVKQNALGVHTGVFAVEIMTLRPDFQLHPMPLHAR